MRYKINIRREARATRSDDRCRNAMSALLPFIPQFQAQRCSVANVENGHQETLCRRLAVAVRHHLRRQL
jgi:hypothetical protein